MPFLTLAGWNQPYNLPDFDFKGIMFLACNAGILWPLMMLSSMSFSKLTQLYSISSREWLSIWNSRCWCNPLQRLLHYCGGLGSGGEQSRNLLVRSIHLHFWVHIFSRITISSILHSYDIVNGGTWTFLTNLTRTCSNLAGGYCFGPNIIILDENDSPCPWSQKKSRWKMP